MHNLGPVGSHFSAVGNGSGSTLTLSCHMTVVSQLLKFPHLSAVGVGLLGVDAPVLLHVAEGVGHVPSSAAIVLFDAVHQVLGAQVHQLARRLGQLALQGAG